MRHASRPSSDGEWAERIREGDYAAFEALFGVYCEELVHFAQYYTRRREVAQDLIQDLFFNIWKRREAWTPRGSLRTYLYSAARKQCLTHVRHLRVERKWQEEARAWSGTRESPERDLQSAELSREAQRVIDGLPERRRQIFILSRQQGLTYAEIAALLGISTNTVEVQMVRALKALRQQLASMLGVGAIP